MDGSTLESRNSSSLTLGERVVSAFTFLSSRSFLGSSVSQITFLNWCLPLLEVSLKLHRATFYGTLRATFPSSHTHAHMAQVVTPVQSSVPLELKDCLSCSSRHTCADDKLQASSNNWIFLFHVVSAQNICLASFVFFLSVELRGFSRPLFSSKVDLNSVNLNRFAEFPDHRYPRPFFFSSHLSPVFSVVWSVGHVFSGPSSFLKHNNLLLHDDYDHHHHPHAGILAVFLALASAKLFG